MAITKISFVGIDTKTTVNGLQGLAMNSITRLEFGALHSPSKNTNRYLSKDRISAFFSDKSDLYDFSLHLCGLYATDLIENQHRSAELLDGLNIDDSIAIQLNFSLRDSDEQLERYCNNILLLAENYEIIVQENNTKANLIKALLQNKTSSSRLRILFDASGGNGKQIKTFNRPYTDVYTGYAGGITPQNIREVCENVNRVSADIPVYIDMESGVRNVHDEFSIQKCTAIIDHVNSLNIDGDGISY